MNILEIRTLRGPNYWSGYWKNLIIMRLDIGAFERKPTNKIKGFYERMIEVMPSLVSHGCSYGEEGGFLKRVQEGTWAGHAIEHFALELQTLAGMDTGYGRTRETGEKGIYNVVFSYVEEEVGRFAARSAVRLWLDLAGKRPLEEIRDELAKDIRQMREIREDVRFGPSTGSLVDEAVSRGIPYIRLNDQSLVQLGYGVNQKRIQATTTVNTNMISVDIAGDKSATKKLLGDMGVPVPKGYRLREIDDLEDTLERVGYPAVIKPLDGNHGKGATVGIKNLDEAKIAWDKAKEYSRWVIVEQQLLGSDFRALVVNNRLIAVAERVPAHVVGDGKHTIQELIDITNSDPRRGYGHENVLTQIDVDNQTLRCIAKAGYTLESKLKKGEILHLKTTANISTGGTAIDCTDEVHPLNVFLFERIAKIIGLDVAGIDVIAPNVSEPLTENGGGIIEVNAAPGFRMHLAPSEGIGRNVAEHVIDMLFPPGTPSRIPIFAITGTNGKTTTTRLIAHILKNSGRTVGFTTTDGTYIGNQQIVRGDNTGPISAQLVLKDPTVEVAVLETARGGIIRSGLGFDHCDIGVVLNVAADHLGLKDVNTLEDLARVKSVVPRAVSRRGFAVLNAEDPNVYAMKELTDGTVVCFSMDENHPNIKRRAERGRISCVYENGYVTILKGKWKVRIEKVSNIPITYGGRAEFMIQNVLAATLACFVHGVSIEDLRVGLTTFNAGTAQTPGRLNFVEVGDVTVLMDYAHNPAGFGGLTNFISKLPNKYRTVVMNGTGDRRDEDIREMGRIAGANFDRIVIRRGHYLRGRDENQTYDLIKEGIAKSKKDPAVRVIPESRDAIHHAIKHGRKGELVVTLADRVVEDIAHVQEYRDMLAEGKVK
ncbi:MAG: cyanophycin synthetase [Acidobacteria bacterium]|nr:cyanophycin synthetase [Acidobacteriota bacterium]MCW5948892.1 cyanophycin synthetase [Pyrinomonadaceae bacterium]